MTEKKPTPNPVPTQSVEVRTAATIRFAGDSGDGMQLVGARFTSASALLGNAVHTLPDFPAEIRAPAGTLAGVSGFQVHFGTQDIHTPGDFLDALVVMNPAALAAHLGDLAKGGILIVNADAFTPENLQAAGYAANPLAAGALADYQVLAVPMQQLHAEAVARVKLSPREADRCKNFFALGLACSLYERPLDSILRWIGERFAKNPAMIEANTRSLKAGHQYGESAAVLPVRYRVPTALRTPGRYRMVRGSEALALGLVAAARQANLPLVFASHPTAPASDVLHYFSDHPEFGARVVQAEDDAAALGMALGASFGGALGACAASGPGLSAMAETLGLAVMAELPCVVINVQRGGPSTGLPTKTEQADLWQALGGRHGEAPLPVVAMATPADGFPIMLEAARLAIRYMTPVIVLADALLAQGAESWKIPAAEELPTFPVTHPTTPNQVENGQAVFHPYLRDERQVRPWAIPGTPGMEHRIGGLEKDEAAGHVSYDPLHHECMVRTRAAKIQGIALDIPPLAVDGPEYGDLLVLGWGGTQGEILTAVHQAQRLGKKVACAHLRHVHPLPSNTQETLKRYAQVLVPELNSGQLLGLLRSLFLMNPVGLHKVQGRRFLVHEVLAKILQLVPA